MHQNLFIWFSKHGVHKFGRTTKWTNRQTDKWTNEHVENILPSPSSMTRQRHKTKHYITVTFITHARIPVLTSVCVRSISFYVDDEPKQFTSIHQAEHHSSPLPLWSSASWSPLPLWSSASFITTTAVKLSITHPHYHCEAVKDLTSYNVTRRKDHIGWPFTGSNLKNGVVWPGLGA